MATVMPKSQPANYQMKNFKCGLQALKFSAFSWREDGIEPHGSGVYQIEAFIMADILDIVCQGRVGQFHVDKVN